MDINVLLDLDGTLTDPRIGFAASINHALEKLRIATVPEQELMPHIGLPLRDTLTQLLGRWSKHRVPAALEHYRERYAQGGVFECTVYPRVAEALKKLSDRGARLFVATSEPRVFAERVLAHCSLERYFQGIYGSEMDGMYAEMHALIPHILQHERLDPARTVVVGDRSHDVRAARAHGLSSVGVLWGYGSNLELVEAGATFLVRDPHELVDALVPGRVSRVANANGSRHPAAYQESWAKEA